MTYLIMRSRMIETWAVTEQTGDIWLNTEHIKQYIRDPGDCQEKIFSLTESFGID